VPRCEPSWFNSNRQATSRRAAKIRKTVRLAIRQNQERLEHHVCIHKTTTATLHPTRVLRLVEFAELGHSPQVQDPKQFNAALLKALKSR